MLIICITIYILSGIAWWLYVKIAFSKGGRYESLFPTTLDFIIIIIIPLFNTLISIYGWALYPPREGINKKNKYIDNFFKIKREE